MASMMIADSYISKMEEYRKNGSDDEWFFAKLTDDLLGQCEPYKAFNAIDSIVNYALTEEEGDLFYDHIQFLIKLGRKSNTTESPQSLKNSAVILIEKALKFGSPQVSSVKELCIWFRLPLKNNIIIK